MDVLQGNMLRMEEKMKEKKEERDQAISRGEIRQL